MINSSAIVAAAYHVPERRLTHESLSDRFGSDVMKRVAASAGICERRTTMDQCASDLAFTAAEALLERNNIDRNSIDLLLFATQTPDYLIPTTACILQDRLKLKTTTAAFDINLGCSQYVYSMGVAHSMLSSGLASRALVLTGDTISRILNPRDRAVVPLFGDAGTATLLDKVPAGQGFRAFNFGTDGSGHAYLIWPTSGLRVPKTPETAEEHCDKGGSWRSQNEMFMDGAAIFLFTLKIVPDAVRQVVSKAGLTMDAIDLFIFHQASELIVESSAKKLQIPREKLHYKLHDVGNSGGSTVGIALVDAWLQGKLKPGMKVVLAAFGVGLSWATAVIQWPETAMTPVCTAQFSDSVARPLAQQIR
jgi:3-oxoacyl-[acyl-carrier-protein] synthase-3